MSEGVSTDQLNQSRVGIAAMGEATFEVIGLLPLLGGVGCFLWGWWQKLQVRRSLCWPCVPGTILRSEVARRVTSRSEVFASRIEYEYKLGSETFRANTICVGGELNSSRRQRAEDRCRRYPVGATVDVYHDPRNPGDACLEQTAEGSWFLYLVAAAFFVTGVLMVLGVRG
jgi:hypothetical protein